MLAESETNIVRAMSAEQFEQAELIEAARRLAYERMTLDTLPIMERAKKMDASFGFQKLRAYRFNPDPNTISMELNLVI